LQIRSGLYAESYKANLKEGQSLEKYVKELNLLVAERGELFEIIEGPSK